MPVCDQKLYVMKMNDLRLKFYKPTILLIVSMIILLGTASAQTAVAARFPKEAVIIKFIGSSETGYNFNVSFTNTTGDKFMIRILDSIGTMLFAGVYSEKKFDKEFRFGKDDTKKVSLVVENLRDNTIQRFDLITGTGSMKDFVWRKID
jgi:hypothetical protein